MKQFKSVKVTKNMIENIACNMCGKKIGKNVHGYVDDYLSIEKAWGYNSPFDGEKHSIDLCCDCYKDFFNKLKLPAE